MTAVNILSVCGFLLFVGLAARNLAAALSQRGVADRIHKIALIGEILIVSLSGLLALVGCYAPIYLLVAGALAYLASRRIGRRYADWDTKTTRVPSLKLKEVSAPDTWNFFALVFVGSLVAIVLAWNIRNDFFSPEKRIMVGDDAAYHVPIVLNLERHRSLWFPLEDYQIAVAEIGVHRGNDARIFFPLNHELLVGLARFVFGPAVEFVRVINYLFMFHLALVIYCFVKLAGESNATAWLIALACFLLPVFQGRLLRGHISVFGNLNNDFFVALLVLSGIYLAVEQWRDLEAGSSVLGLHPNTLLLGAIILVAVGTKWYAALYSVVLLILFILPILIHNCWRDLKLIKLSLTLCLVAIVTNGALVRNFTYFGAISADLDFFSDHHQSLARLIMSTRKPLVDIGKLVLRTLVTHGGGLSIVFPALAILRALRGVRLILWKPQTSLRAIVSTLWVDLGVLAALIGSAILMLSFAIPFGGGWPYFETTIRYAMPAFVLFQCVLLTLTHQERWGGLGIGSWKGVSQLGFGRHRSWHNAASNSQCSPLLSMFVIGSAAFSVAQYFLLRHVAWLIGTAFLLSLVLHVVVQRFAERLRT